MFENFQEKSKENGPLGENDKKVRGLGRKTRQEMGKRNKMTSLRFQTGGKTSDIPGY